MKEIDKKKFL